jgi:hypothetical protein
MDNRATATLTTTPREEPTVEDAAEQAQIKADALLDLLGSGYLSISVSMRTANTCRETSRSMNTVKKVLQEALPARAAKHSATSSMTGAVGLKFFQEQYHTESKEPQLA